MLYLKIHSLTSNVRNGKLVNVRNINQQEPALSFWWLIDYYIVYLIDLILE